MRIYDLVKQILTDQPETRSSDKKLIWRVLEHKHGGLEYVTKQMFFEINTESIRRARQLVQQNHPDLKPNKQVDTWRQEMEQYKGTIFYRTEL